MTEHIVNSLNPRTPNSDTVVQNMHRDPEPGQTPLPGDPPVPGEPPVPSDPPVVPPSPVADRSGRSIPPPPGRY